jgi:hypothetical protein
VQNSRLALLTTDRFVTSAGVNLWKNICTRNVPHQMSSVLDIMLVSGILISLDASYTRLVFRRYPLLTLTQDTSCPNRTFMAGLAGNFGTVLQLNRWLG